MTSSLPDKPSRPSSAGESTSLAFAAAVFGLVFVMYVVAIVGLR